MEKFDDRLDGFSPQEYENLAQAYNSEFADENVKDKGNQNFGINFTDARQSNLNMPFDNTNFEYFGVEKMQNSVLDNANFRMQDNISNNHNIKNSNNHTILNGAQSDNYDSAVYGNNGGIKNFDNKQILFGNENSSNEQLYNDSELSNYVVAPTPQISYSGLNDSEQMWLNDLIQDLRQYYNDDYGLSEYLIIPFSSCERPLLYFVSKAKILSKIVNIMCSIFDKSRLNKDMYNLFLALMNLSRKVNSK